MSLWDNFQSAPPPNVKICLIFVKNELMFQMIIQMPKIQGKYAFFKERGGGGGAAPDGKLRKK